MNDDVTHDDELDTWLNMLDTWITNDLEELSEMTLFDLTLRVVLIPGTIVFLRKVQNPTYFWVPIVLDLDCVKFRMSMLSIQCAYFRI